MELRTVTIELLRAGPRHNQLLSRLTRYLGVCGDSQAGVVTLPYEHADFESQLAELRYEVAGEEGRRRLVLERTGREMAEILGQIPGLDGVFSERRDDLTHLRLVLSASELALLPFELSKVPVRAGVSPEGWLALQTQTPVCITRHVRSVSADRFRWPEKPCILFVSGLDVPEDEHLDALHEAIRPWLVVEDRDEAAAEVGDGAGAEGRDGAGAESRDAAAAEGRKGAAGERRKGAAGEGTREEWLTELRGATLPELIDACARRPYTHVHILAHGAEDPEGRPGTFGVALRDGVVSGRRLADALQPLIDGRVHRPAVVTLATCSSAGQPGDVRTPDVSVAHELHASGIPVVVASQFPLSVDASEPFVRLFYDDQLWGEHPLTTLFKLRRRLHSEFAQDYHDWASLVAYETLPADLDERLETLRYLQTRRAQSRALERVETRIRGAAGSDGGGWAPPASGEYADLVDEVERLGERLPDEGVYATECMGLRASSAKRLAEVAFRLAVAPATPGPRRQELLAESGRRLEDALRHYRVAARAFLASSDDMVQRRASLHWFLVQVASLQQVLGRGFDGEAWSAGRFAARVASDGSDPEARGWAEASLAELDLVRLADPGAAAEAEEDLVDEILEYARSIVDVCGGASEQVVSTRRQFRRYVDWWAAPEFVEALGGTGLRDGWDEDDGVIPTARRVVEILGG